MTFYLAIISLLLWLPPEEVKLTERTILKDQITILVPEDFGIMSVDALKVKYPNDDHPDLVFTNESSSINLHFEHTEFEATSEQIPLYLEQFIRFFKTHYPASAPHDKGVKEINGHTVGFLEINLPAGDGELYNLMFYTAVDNRLMIISFNCSSELMNEWKAIAHKIMHSLQVNK